MEAMSARRDRGGSLPLRFCLTGRSEAAKVTSTRPPEGDRVTSSALCDAIHSSNVGQRKPAHWQTEVHADRLCVSRYWREYRFPGPAVPAYYSGSSRLEVVRRDIRVI